MPVYVDNERHPFGQLIMCHMIADTIPELHSMADKIGLSRKWFQDHRVPHYDICLSKRALALRNGAIEADRRAMVDVMRRIGRRRYADEDREEQTER